MSPAPVVDPALFRLRAFERGSVRPLQVALGLPEGPLEDDPFEGFQPRSVVQLAALLLVELDAWIAVGQESGYFAPCPEDRSPDSPLGLESLRERFAPFVPLARPDERFSAETFAQILGPTLDDLTPARRGYLWRLHFEGDDAWHVQLRRVQSVAEELARRPGLSLDTAQADAIAWALDGAESAVGPMGLPSDWRAGITDSQTAFTVPSWREQGRRYFFLAAFKHTPETLERLDELAQVRGQLLRAAQWIAEDELTSAQLRTAAELRRDRGEGAYPREETRWSGESQQLD